MKGNGIWMLVSGLAVGFIVGRELTTKSSPGETARTEVAAPAAPSGGAAPAGAAGGTIDPSWLTEDAFGSADALKGLTPAQRFQVLKFYNETPCDCGCPHGSYAKCKKEDPGCPRAPKVLDQAIALARQGKSFSEIAAATKKGNDAPSAPAPSTSQKVELARWTPIEGPKLAKVTIVEFSDFQ